MKVYDIFREDGVFMTTTANIEAVKRKCLGGLRCKSGPKVFRFREREVAPGEPNEIQDLPESGLKTYVPEADMKGNITAKLQEVD